MKTKRQFVIAASVAGLLAFVGDFSVTLALGFFYPNYNHFKLVMSELGSNQSPVAMWVNMWWITFGVLIIIFAIGFKQVFIPNGKAVVVTTILIMLFGIGAGIGAGLFPMEPGGTEITLVGKLHGICAGIGFLAIMFVPVVLLAVFPRTRWPRLYWLSVGVFVLGLVFFILFLASENAHSTGGLLSYTGLWQRLFLLNYYSYLSVLTLVMIQSLPHSKRIRKRHT